MGGLGLVAGGRTQRPATKEEASWLRESRSLIHARLHTLRSAEYEQLPLLQGRIVCYSLFQ